MQVDYIGKMNEMVKAGKENCEEFFKYAKRYICYIASTIIKQKIWVMWNREDILEAGLEGIAIALKKYDAKRGAFCSFA